MGSGRRFYWRRLTLTAWHCCPPRLVPIQNRAQCPRWPRIAPALPLRRYSRVFGRVLGVGGIGGWVAGEGGWVGGGGGVGLQWAGLAGLRVGYMVAHPEIVVRVKAIKQPYNITVVSDVAARAALKVWSRRHVVRCSVVWASLIHCTPDCATAWPCVSCPPLYTPRSTGPRSLPLKSQRWSESATPWSWPCPCFRG